MGKNFAEDKLQMAAVEMIKLCFPTVLFTHPANQGRSPQEGAKLKKMGVLAGIPDLLLWWPVAQSGAIELKVKASLSGNQNYVGKELLSMGHRWAVCHTLEEIYDTIIEWGVKSQGRYLKIPQLRSPSQRQQEYFNFMKP